MPQPTLQSLPIELRQQILHHTITPCLSWDPVFWTEAEASQDRFIADWAKTLRLVNKGFGEDVGWVEERWLEGLRREREARYKGWWVGLEKFMMKP